MSGFFLPTAEELAQGQPHCERALGILQWHIQHRQQPPYFLGVNAEDPSSTYPIKIQPLHVESSCKEVALVYRDNPSKEFSVVLFGSTVCGSEVTALDGNKRRVTRDVVLHEGFIREVYSLNLPCDANSVMQRVFTAQVESIAGIIAFVAANFRLPPRAVDIQALDEQMEDATKMTILGPPICKVETIADFDVTLLDNFDAHNLCPTLLDDNPMSPPDQLYDVNQVLIKNWLGYMLFSSQSSSVIVGRFRFWISDTLEVKCRFLADSIREIFGHGRRWDVT
ncbi:hypothetical protein BJ165DRAFT_1530104 [Panaeolus papilionaceus]|nr:hypothetical protein BJ165DRAFT_1530104 [Panaeolus papilionaceus]